MKGSSDQRLRQVQMASTAIQFKNQFGGMN